MQKITGVEGQTPLTPEPPTTAPTGKTSEPKKEGSMDALGSHLEAQNQASLMQRMEISIALYSFNVTQAYIKRAERAAKEMRQGG